MEKEFSVRRLSIEYVNNQSPRQNTHLVQQPGNPIPTDNERQGSRLISLNPKAKTVEQEFRKQESDKAVTQKICTSQYENAQYESVTTKKRFDDSLLQLASVADNFRDLRFAITTKDIQGISGSPAEQQPSGKWKCVRGSMEVPMRLGKEYRESIPVYEPMPMPPDCFKKLYADPFFLSIASIPLPHEVKSCLTSRVIGYMTKKRMIKEEACTKGGTCLVLYGVDTQGKASRQTIAVSTRSLQEIFP